MYVLAAIEITKYKFDVHVALLSFSQEQYLKEVELRQRHNLDKRHVMSLLTAPPPDLFEREVAKLGSVQGRALSEYKYGIIMPEGDRSLQAIYTTERPNRDHVRIM
jgi:hypothetical protein